MKNHPKYSSGQEVDSNPMNCVLIYIYRNPPDLIAVQEFVFRRNNKKDAQNASLSTYSDA